MGDTASASPLIPRDIDTKVAGPSNSQVTVIFPSQSITLRIPISSSATVTDLKNVIQDRCPGRPAPKGQRIIWKGRFLRDDEGMQEVLGSGTLGEPTVYVSVHPTSWTDKETAPDPFSRLFHSKPSTIPPSTTTTLPASSSASTLASNVMRSLLFNPPNLSSASSVNIPQQFVIHQHTNAVRLLAKQPIQMWLGPGDFRSAKNLAKDVLAAQRVAWPPAGSLDHDLYAKAQEQPELLSSGASYAWTVIDNLPYLCLVTGSPSPNSLQLLALEILTYTFPLLSLLPTLPATALSTSFRMLPPRRLDALPPIRPIQPRNQRQLTRLLSRLRSIVIRSCLRILRNPTRLLVPILLVVFRAAFVIYVFGWTVDRALPWFIAVCVWAVWETWAIIRADRLLEQAARPAVNPAPAADRAVPAAANPEAAAQPGDEAAAAEVPPQQNQNQNENRAPAPQPPAAAFDPNLNNPFGPNAQLAHVFDYLASYHLAWERRQLGLDSRRPGPVGATEDPQDRGPAAVPPEQLEDQSRVQRCVTFTLLFLYSLVPEVWAKRVDSLRIREAQVRDVYGRFWEEPRPGENNEPVPEQERIRAERRRMLTGWRKSYVQRVLGGVGQDVDL